jgi:hypothetical protein
MVGQFDPREPGDYDRVRARINEVMDAAQRETMDGRGHRASLVARGERDRSAGGWWTHRTALALAGAIVVLGAVGLLMQR